ncbi:MAG TPA: dihydroneopterin aldolase [Chitinophagaceae bacterium]|jgi:dihydroneopterin aldolase|nr:dihydroneopterin aldolase [Chitinophagaceae bacterium]
MNDLITIELKQLRFFAFHGLYEEEKRTGNEFEVNLSVGYTPAAGTITGLQETVNYASMYALLKTEMQKPRELLETFVMEMTELMHASFPIIKRVSIEITKLQPPIARFNGTVGVRYSKEY